MRHVMCDIHLMRHVMCEQERDLRLIICPSILSCVIHYQIRSQEKDRADELIMVASCPHGSDMIYTFIDESNKSHQNSDHNLDPC
jgi:hypothetical protein